MLLVPVALAGTFDHTDFTPGAALVTRPAGGGSDRRVVIISEKPIPCDSEGPMRVVALDVAWKPGTQDFPTGVQTAKFMDTKTWSVIDATSATITLGTAPPNAGARGTLTFEAKTKDGRYSLSGSVPFLVCS